MTPTEVRSRLLEALEADLVGPFVPDSHPQGGQEVLPIAPSRYYLTGFLAPRGGSAPDVDDQDSVEDSLGAGSESQAEDAGNEEPEAKRPVRFPASMGMSVFLPPGDGDTIEASVYFADYDKIELALDHADKKVTGWKRVPHGPVKVTVPLDPKALEKGVSKPELMGLVLKGELRTTDMDGLEKGTRVLSLFVVNERTPEEVDRDRKFVFQVKLELVYEKGFVARPNRRGEDSTQDDLAVAALMFRDRMEWAVGHNTSVEGPAPKEVRAGKVTRLRTTPLPHYEVPIVDHRAIPGATTEMERLFALDGPGLVAALTPLVDAYGKWIDEQARIPLRESLEETRRRLLGQARRAKERIAAGIALLAKDPEVLRAFRLTNQAMFMAAWQADRTRPKPRYDETKRPAWRPFQLAFLLMNLPSMADPLHDDRKLADLIYFPTGGGKTEAYLGLIAFTLLLRRLRGRDQVHEGRGVTVLLRYTLRLLTLDQLGRAATLICALEYVRAKYPKELGNARFTVGLWVGASATANRFAELYKALNDHSLRDDLPFPLTNCPWCGESIKRQGMKLLDADGKPTTKNFASVAVYCDQEGCEFTERKRPGLGMPVLFVDEHIYQEPPSFLVATVDKFAMLPWRGDAGMLFGRATHIDEKRVYGVMDKAPKGAKPLPDGLLPPELIVQDELHLISGPLGTMVGLYEAAIDYLCERPAYGMSRPPKVVCSTATVRRAREQIQALFGRQMSLFPPRGINEDDNFFAHVDRSRPGRLYVGVGAPGRALRAVSVRSYAALLAAGQKHFDPKGPPNQSADPYMTLIGYFNSLRELGGMRRLVEDEVESRVRNIETEKRPLLFDGPHPWAKNRRSLIMPEELTSRVKTETVKETKSRLAAPRTSTNPEPLDVVLASNMISVGLDVDRLGLMVVTGQPKTTSEYIQATSRVGRSNPGLVVTCLNVMRPRDRSHYERFVAYHESLYRDVEATSVTPFSKQALDRGFTGSLLSMIRHGIEAMEPPTGVMEIGHHRPDAERILEWMVARARSHRIFPDKDAESRIEEHLRRRGKSFLDDWQKVVLRTREGAGARTYSKNDRKDREGIPVLFTAQDPPPEHFEERHFQVPTSMRDVEPNVHVWVRFQALNEGK